MFGKKNNSVFTIKFNTKIPEEKKAVDILNSLGRKKAPLIAAALCAYEENPAKERGVDFQDNSAADTFSISVHTPQKTHALPEIAKTIDSPETNEKEIKRPFDNKDDEEYSEILAAINGFEEMES